MTDLANEMDVQLATVLVGGALSLATLVMQQRLRDGQKRLGTASAGASARHDAALAAVADTVNGHNAAALKAANDRSAAVCLEAVRAAREGIDRATRDHERLAVAAATAEARAEADRLRARVADLEARAPDAAPAAPP